MDDLEASRVDSFTGVAGIWYPHTPGTTSPVNCYPVVWKHRHDDKSSRWFTTQLFWYPGTNSGETNGVLALLVNWYPAPSASSRAQLQPSKVNLLDLAYISRLGAKSCIPGMVHVLFCFFVLFCLFFYVRITMMMMNTLKSGCLKH